MLNGQNITDNKMVKEAASDKDSKNRNKPYMVKKTPIGKGRGKDFIFLGYPVHGQTNSTVAMHNIRSAKRKRRVKTIN